MQEFTSFIAAKFNLNRSPEDAEKIYKQRISDAKDIYHKYKDSFEYRLCPVCGGKDYEILPSFLDLYGVVRCQHCSTDYVNPCPTENALNDYYKSAHALVLTEKILSQRHKVSNASLFDPRQNLLLNELEKKLLLFPSKKISILEIGCNSGSFLSSFRTLLKEKGLINKVDLLGIDIDDRAIANKVDDDINLKCLSAENLLSLEGQYDFIVFFELIEHLSDPFKFMQLTHQLLKTNGMAIFTTPNALGLEIAALDYEGFRPIAHSIFPPMHLNAFSIANITHFALRSGFNLKYMQTPGKLDVDIVSTYSKHVKDLGFKKIADLSDENKNLLQYLFYKLNMSSHMLACFEKREKI